MTARERLVADAWHDWHAVGASPTGEWDHEIVDGELIVRYPVAGMGEPGIGNAWIVGFFDTRGSVDRYQIGGSELRIDPPDGHAFTNRPRGAELREGTAIWRGADTDGYESDLPGGVLLTYAPEDDRFGVVTARATVVTTTAPVIVRDTAIAGGIPIILLGIGLLGVVRFRSWVGERADIVPASVRYGTALAIGGLVVAGVTAVLGVVLRDPGWLVIALGAIAYAVIARPGSSLRTRVGAHWLLCAIVGWMILVVFLVGSISPWYPLLVAGPVVSTLAFGAVAVALRTGRSPVPGATVILLAPMVGVASVMPTVGFGHLLVGGYTTLTVVGTILAGGALFVWDHLEHERDGGQPSKPTGTE